MATPGATLFDIGKRLARASRKVDGCAKLGHYTLGFFGAVGAVVARDFVQEREALWILRDDPTGGRQHELGVGTERGGGFAIIVPPREDVIARRVEGLAVCFR